MTSSIHPHAVLSHRGGARGWGSGEVDGRRGRKNEKKKENNKNELRHGEWSGKLSEGAMFVTLK